MFKNFNDFKSSLDSFIFKARVAKAREIDYASCQTNNDYNIMKCAIETKQKAEEAFLLDVEQNFQELARLKSQLAQVQHSLKEMIKIAAREDESY